MTPRHCWRRAGGLCCSLGATHWRLRTSARGARWATTWASVRGVQGEVCNTLLGTNPSGVPSGVSATTTW